MEATEGIKASIKELHKAQAEKSKRVKDAVKQSQQTRHTQTGQPPRSE